MKVICWNMGFGHGRWREEPGLHDRAWHWIAAVDPDLAFIQESEPPSWAQERWGISILPHCFWASAILARRGTNLLPAELPGGGIIEKAEGYHATAELELTDGERLLIASVHASPNEAPVWGHPGYHRSEIARPSVGKPWWNDVTFAAYRDLVAGRRFILAGDWNTSRYVDENGEPSPAGREFFERAADAGWVDISVDADGREGKTWYGSTNPRPHQPDHVFADGVTAAGLRSFRIEPYPVEGHDLSDHAPLALELDLAVAASVVAGAPEVVPT